jgi:hypothetical protein
MKQRATQYGPPVRDDDKEDIMMRTATMLALTVAATLLAPDVRRRRRAIFERPTLREMMDPAWRPWLRWDWCADARGVRFRDEKGRANS